MVMTPQRTVVVVQPDVEDGPMVSRLPTYLHPVAGRPLIWHVVSTLLGREGSAREVLIVAPPGFQSEHLGDAAPQIEVRILDRGSPALRQAIEGLDAPLMVAHGSASLDPATVRRLAGSEVGSWLGASTPQLPGALVAPEQLLRMLEREEPLAAGNVVLAPHLQLPVTSDAFVVRTRSDLARLQVRVRDQLVRVLMDNGASFLLPESVHVDVDVRIGRDTVVYPGVVIEGQTTIGEETVIGPGCRIIDSWIGSGVEMKGWNYVAHTSVRNRAILEPYVRRGFD